MLEEGNELLYFGDLDYEGIGIYEQLAQILGNDFPVKPFVPAYEAMLLKGQEISFLPQTKEKQNRNIKDVFFSYFHSDIVERMKHILQAEKYIPQEILNITDY